jgi:hypothetical protein
MPPKRDNVLLEAKQSVEKIKIWNTEAERLINSLKKILKEKFPEIAVEFKLDSFSNIYENIGFEYYLPRNYLSYEKVIVSFCDKQLKFYFGKYESLDSFKAVIYLTLLDELKSIDYAKKDRNNSIGTIENT